MWFTSTTVSVVVLEDGDAVVRRPQAADFHAMDDRQRSGEQHDVDGGDPAAVLDDEGQRGRRGDAEPDARRQLEPRDQRERPDAGQAAEQIDHVGAQRRPSRQIAPHSMRDGDEQRRHRRRTAAAAAACSRPAPPATWCRWRNRSSTCSAARLRAAARLTARITANWINGNQTNRFLRRFASRQPTPMPRKLASRMKLEK